MAEGHTNIVFEFEDGSQALVVAWENGTVTIATREQPWLSWSPPTLASKIEGVNEHGFVIKG